MKQISVKEVMEKVDRGEGLTVEEVIIYEQNRKPIKHVYGKYGNLAKEYLENHCQWKLMLLAGEVPEYLHNIDKQADQIYEVMYEKLSKDERYKRTGNYLEDVRRLTQIQMLIEEEILNELVYVK